MDESDFELDYVKNTIKRVGNMTEKEHEVGCALQSFFYLQEFVEDLEQLTVDEKVVILNIVKDIMAEAGKVAKTIVKEGIRRIISNL